MRFDHPFESPVAAGFAIHIGLVTDVQDSSQNGRVRIKLTSADPDGTAQIWARVAVPFAGTQCGAFLIPDVGDEVVVAFVAGDPRHPVVLGSLWNGEQQAPEQISGNSVDRWSFTGKAGTRIAIVEQGQGSETVSIETPLGVSGTFTDEAGGKIELSAAGNTITLDSSGITINAPSGFTLTTSTESITASTINVNSPIANYSGMITSNALQTTAVISTSYTPGAGNVW
jgi:phage baseplate assembly protein gpV